jgi:hypothetical protein
MNQQVIYRNVWTQLSRFTESHINPPMFLILDPENYRALIRELAMDGPVVNRFRLLGLEIVVIPIPETLYIAADPHVELLKYEMQQRVTGEPEGSAAEGANNG